MIKKISFLIGIMVVVGIVIYNINNNFTYFGLIQRIKAFPDLRSTISRVSFQNAPSIGIPDLAGISTICRGINFILSGIYAVAEFALALVKIVPSFARSVIDLISYCLGF